MDGWGALGYDDLYYAEGGRAKIVKSLLHDM